MIKEKKTDRLCVYYSTILKPDKADPSRKKKSSLKKKISLDYYQSVCLSIANCCYKFIHKLYCTQWYSE